MSLLHLTAGIPAFGCVDMDGAEIELNIVLNLLRENLADYNAQLAKVRLARIKLCRQSPESCLAFIRSAEMMPIPVSVAFLFQILPAN